MKPGICSCVLEQAYPTEEALRRAAEIGYEGYEIDVGVSPRYSIFGGETDLARMKHPVKWQRLRKVADSAGIEICSICLGALHDFGLADPDQDLRNQGISIIHASCRAAAEIGTTIILVPIMQPKDLSLEEATKNLVHSLGRCAESAEKFEAILAIENMPHDLFGPAHKMLEVIGQVGSPNCQVYYDIANPEVVQIHAKDEIPLLSTLIKQVHIKDLRMPATQNVSIANIGEGEIDLKPGVDALKQAGYEGFVVVEVPTEKSSAVRAAEVNLKSLVELLDL